MATYNNGKMDLKKILRLYIFVIIFVMEKVRTQCIINAISGLLIYGHVIGRSCFIFNNERTEKNFLFYWKKVLMMMMVDDGI